MHDRSTIDSLSHNNSVAYPGKVMWVLEPFFHIKVKRNQETDNR